MGAAADDWRRAGQEAYLPAGTTFVRRAYRPYSDSWEHDHCEFCWEKFAKGGPLTEGLTTTDDHPNGAEYHWVCEACFRDFAEELAWRRADRPEAADS